MEVGGIGLCREGVAKANTTCFAMQAENGPLWFIWHTSLYLEEDAKSNAFSGFLMQRLASSRC